MIFLIGYMCSGKTTVARALSHIMKLQFTDLDKYIEKSSGMSIPEIFAIKGEQWFRKSETEALQTLIESGTNRIISCGGGTPCFNDNINLMKSSGLIVYLKLSPEMLASRISHSKTTRPLLDNLEGPELLRFVKEHLKYRETFYNQADIIAEKDMLKTANLFKIIIDATSH